MKQKSNSAILIFIFLIVLISHFASRNINTADSAWYIPTALSIVKEGNTNLDEYKELIKDGDYRLEKINGHIYTISPLGASLIAVPFVFLIDKGLSYALTKIPPIEEYIKKYIRSRGHTLPPPEKISFMTVYPGAELFIASLIIALNAVFIYLIASLFLDIKGSLFVAFIFAFCTSSWSIASRALWQHGPSMLMLTVSLYLILLAKNMPHLIQFVSIPLVFSCIVRPQNIFSLFLLTVFVLVYYKQYFLHYFLWAAMLLIPFLIYNFSVYHSLLSPYYLLKHNSSNPHLFEALLGNLISPARGLFIFSPILLFSIPGLIRKIKNRQLMKLDYFLCGIIFLHWIALSSHINWWAGWTFGPRYMSDMIPYFTYFLIPVLEISKLGAIKVAILNSLFFCLILISFFIHYRGATKRDAYVWNFEPVNIDTNSERVWDWHDLQFLRGINK